MANGITNPLAAPLTTLKQIGEQANVSIQSLGTGMARAASQGLDSLIQGTPALPGLPAAGGQAAGLPSLKNLMPANLTQALSQIENVLIPPGLTKPSALVKGMTPTPTPTPTPTETPTPAVPTPAQAQAVTGRRRITELGGY
jgi:hypothetical protein